MFKVKTIFLIPQQHLQEAVLCIFKLLMQIDKKVVSVLMVIIGITDNELRSTSNTTHFGPTGKKVNTHFSWNKVQKAVLVT